jgi:protein TonB
MKTRSGFVFLCIPALLCAHPALAALSNAAEAPARSAVERAGVSTQSPLTEDQALHALETEISRKVGLRMSATDYPAEARRWKWGGVTLVQVMVGKDGVMRNISVGRSSGFRILDEQAVRIVSRVSAPSWIPERLRGRDVAVLVPVGFLPPTH